MENLLGKNLKLLRKNKGYNQTEVATVVGKGDTTIGNWEKGISEPNTSDLIRLSQYFEVTVDDLIKNDLSKSDLNKKKHDGKNTHKSDLNSDRKSDLNAAKLVHLGGSSAGKTGFVEALSTGKKQRLPMVVTVDQHGQDNIVFVPIKARAGYLLGYGDPSFIETLPSFRLPGFINSTYRMFEVEGPSMGTTISDHDKVIGEWCENFEQIRDNRVYIVVHAGGVAVKRVVNRAKETGKLYLKSDTITHREDYPTIEVDITDVHEVWYVRMRLTANLSEPSELYTKMNELEINMLKVMKHLNLQTR